MEGTVRPVRCTLTSALTGEPDLQDWLADRAVTVERRADLRALLCFDLDWPRFIPHQVAAGSLDLPGIPDRVAAAIRDALDGIG